MDEMLNSLLGGELEQLKGKLSAKAEFPSDKAQAFVPAIVEQVTQLFGSGSLDLTSLMGDVDIGELTEKLDPAQLAAKAGVTEDEAKAGLGEVLPDLLAKAKSALGGGLGGLDLGSLLGGDS